MFRMHHEVPSHAYNLGVPPGRLTWKWGTAIFSGNPGKPAINGWCSIAKLIYQGSQALKNDQLFFKSGPQVKGVAFNINHPWFIRKPSETRGFVIVQHRSMMCSTEIIGAVFFRWRQNSLLDTHSESRVVESVSTSEDYDWFMIMVNGWIISYHFR